MKARGFSTLQLLVIVAVIGYLLSIVGPRFGRSIQKTNEASTKNNLLTLRDGASVYYGEAGAYPRDDLAVLALNARYVSRIPTAKTPGHHPHSEAVHAGASGAAAVDDGGGWAYVNNADSAEFGRIWVNCTHTDMKGLAWSSY